MLRYPIVITLWAVIPPAIVFSLSYLSPRFSVKGPRSTDQPWGCRAVAMALAIAQAALLLALFLFHRSQTYLKLVQAWPWAFEGVLLLGPGIQATPVILMARRYDHPLRRLGITRTQAVSRAAAAAAAYFLLVFLQSTLRHFSGEGWDRLYTNDAYGPNFYRWPLAHSLTLVTLGAIAACADEILFRGFALLPLARAIGPAGAITATALFWGMEHFDVSKLVVFFPLGLLLGWMFYRTGSLVPSATFHVLWNLGAGSDLVFGRLRAAGTQWTSAEHFLYIGGGSLVMALLCGLFAAFASRAELAETHLHRRQAHRH